MKNESVVVGPSRKKRRNANTNRQHLFERREKKQANRPPFDLEAFLAEGRRLASFEEERLQKERDQREREHADREQAAQWEAERRRTMPRYNRGGVEPTHRTSTPAALGSPSSREL